MDEKSDDRKALARRLQSVADGALTAAPTVRQWCGEAAVTIAETAEGVADAKRFVFWFSPQAKMVDMNGYLRGMREGWTLDQWRAFVDESMAANETGK